jgi:hypothetical protein
MSMSGFVRKGQSAPSTSGWLMNRDTTRKLGLNSRRLLIEIGYRLGDSSMNNVEHLGRFVEAKNWQESR